MSRRKPAAQLTMFDAAPANGNGGHVNLTIKPVKVRKKSAAPKVWTIYRHIHRASQKCYVGLTKHSMEVRWIQHIGTADRGARLYFACAIRKHGADAFDHEVLETVDSLGAAEEAEQWWIAHFGCDDPMLGYNLLAGGNVAINSHLTPAELSANARRSQASRTPEERSASSKKSWANRSPEAKERFLALGHAASRSIPPEVRHEIAQKRSDAMTPEQHAENLRHARESMTSEERSEHLRRRWASIPKEERSAQKVAMWAKIPDDERGVSLTAYWASLTPEERAERGRKVSHGISDEQRSAVSAAMKARCDAMTPEARSEKSRNIWVGKTREEMDAIAQKRWATRRANAAKRLADAANDTAGRPSMRLNLLRELPAPAAKKKAA